MTQEDAKIIFGNFTEIAIFTDMFTEELELALGSVVEGGQGTDVLGALFLLYHSHSDLCLLSPRRQSWNDHTSTTLCGV